MTSADNVLEFTSEPEPKPVSLAIAPDGEPHRWCPPEHLPAEAVELLDLLRRWPAVPSALARQLAADLDDDPGTLLALLLAEPDDGRRSPYLSEMAEGVVWVTTAGHSACGSQRRTSAPSTRKIDHAIAVTQVAHDWMGVADAINEQTRWGDELEVSVEPGSEYVASFGINIGEALRFAAAADLGPGAATIKSEHQRAWNSDAAVPDLVVVELWHPIIQEAAEAGSHPLAEQQRQWLHGLWAHAKTREAMPSWSPLAQRKEGHHVIAIEVERSVKAPRLLIDKVNAHAAAIAVGAWDVVVWLVDDQKTARAVQRAMHAALPAGAAGFTPQLIVATAELSPTVSRAMIGGLDALPMAHYRRQS